MRYSHAVHWNYCGYPSWRRPVRVLAGAGWLGLSVVTAAAQPRDKSQHTLVQPTPSDQVREMSTDRPDQTESAYTVDAGHFQAGMDLMGAVFDRNRSGGAEVQTQAWGTSLNLKAGLWNNVDLQLLFEPYVEVTKEDLVAGSQDTSSGFGEFQTRVKINLWGNDGGKTALALMPLLRESDQRNGKTEGGIIVPWAIELSAGWGLAGMTEFDFVSDGGGGRDTEYFNTITVSHDLVGSLGAYVEFAALVTPERGGRWQGQVDWGGNFGVTDSAPDFNPFAGLSLRF